MVDRPIPAASPVAKAIHHASRVAGLGVLGFLFLYGLAQAISYLFLGHSIGK